MLSFCFALLSLLRELCSDCLLAREERLAAKIVRDGVRDGLRIGNVDDRMIGD
jgi:hypothetical protein